MPFVVVTQLALARVWPRVPLTVRLFPAPRTKLIFPVVAEPIVNVCSLVVPTLPAPSRTNAFAPLLAEIEAVGVPAPCILRTENRAESVEVPPTRISERKD